MYKNVKKNEINVNKFQLWGGSSVINEKWGE